jgi:hypothetical protein
MTFSRVLVVSAIILGCFVAGFLLSLGIHWSIRPSIESELNLPPAFETEQAEYVELVSTSEQLKTQVASLEDELARVEVSHDIDEGHARALIHELQTYRDERDSLFADLERRKQRMRDKLEELDSKILEQIELRDSAPQPSDYDVANDMISLLSYPHILNELATLNSALLERPKQHRELVDQRFELMVQPESYTHTDAIYDRLLPVVERLNKQHQNSTTLQTVFCSVSFCEIQARMQQPQPYFDYWQQWLTELRQIEMTKLIEHQVAIEEPAGIVGTVIVHLL